MAKDALVALKICWKYGGQQPKMHPAIIQDNYPNAADPNLRKVGAVQYMQFRQGKNPFYEQNSEKDFTGIPKVMNQELWKRELLTDGMCTKGRRDKDKVIIVETSGLEVMGTQADFSVGTLRSG